MLLFTYPKSQRLTQKIRDVQPPRAINAHFPPMASGEGYSHETSAKSIYSNSYLESLLSHVMHLIISCTFKLDKVIASLSYVFPQEHSLDPSPSHFSMCYDDVFLCSSFL